MQSSIVVTVDLEEFRRNYEKGFTKENHLCRFGFGYLYTALNLGWPMVTDCHGLIAMLGVYELLRMKGLNTMTPEGLLTLLATFALTIPWKII